MEEGDYSHPDVLQSVRNDRYHSQAPCLVFPRCDKPGKHPERHETIPAQKAEEVASPPHDLYGAGATPPHYPFLKGGEMKTSIRWGGSVAVAVFLYTRPNPLWLLIYTIGIITLLAREFDR